MWPYRGGIAQFSESLANEMIGQGYEVSAVSFSRQYPSLLFPGNSQYTESKACASVIEAHRLLDSLNPFSWKKTADFVIDEKPDVVLIPYWMSFFAPALGKVARRVRRANIKVIGIIHNALPHERRPGDRMLAQYFLASCDGLLVLSDNVQADVESLVTSVPVMQVAHPVYDHFGPSLPKREARRKLNLDAERPTILFFGFIRRYKGLHVLLDAMPLVLEKVPDAQLVVAGEFYSEEKALREKARNMADNVRFDSEYIPDARVAQYFSAVDVVVQPYLRATQSGVAQIAFHFGKPVITTDVGGLAEIVPDGKAGLVVPPEAPEALAKGIITYFNDNLEERMVQEVERERKKYTWSAVVKVIEQLMRTGT